MRAAAAAVLVVAGVVGLLAAIPAGATAPGENGEITFRRFIGPGDGVSTIFTIRPDGTGEHQVTTSPPGMTQDRVPGLRPADQPVHRLPALRRTGLQGHGRAA